MCLVSDDNKEMVLLLFTCLLFTCLLFTCVCLPLQEIVVQRSLKGAMHIELYSKCIIANKTGLDLEYSVNVVVIVVVIIVVVVVVDKKLFG